MRGTKVEDQDSRAEPGAGRRRNFDDEFEETEILDPSRPAIPVRPRDRNYHDDDNELPQIVDEKDLSGMGRLSDEGEELEDDSPEIVVVKEGRDLTREEFQAEKIRLRNHPNAPSTVPSSSRATIQPSLKFSSSNKPTTSSIGKRKGIDLVSDNNYLKAEDGWQDLVKKTKGEKKVLVSTITEEREAAERASIKKKQSKLDLKARNKKAKSLMSFS